MHDDVLKKVSKLTEDEKKSNDVRSELACRYVSYQSTRQRIRLEKEMKVVTNRRMSLNKTGEEEEEVADEDGEESGPEASVHHFDSEKDLESISGGTSPSHLHFPQPGKVKGVASEHSALLQVLLCFGESLSKSVSNGPLQLTPGGCGVASKSNVV